MTDWYTKSREAVKRIYGQDWKLFCGLLSATSATMSVKANATKARRVYDNYKATGTISREGLMSSHYKSCLKVVETGKPGGRKCQSFYQNLIGNETPVTVDVWIMRLCGLKGKQPTKKQYDQIEAEIQSQAEQLGITPAQLQAQLWVQARGDSSGYDTELRQRRLF